MHPYTNTHTYTNTQRRLLCSPPPHARLAVAAAEFEKEWKKIKHEFNPTPKKHKRSNNTMEMIVMGTILTFMFWTVIWVSYHQ